MKKYFALLLCITTSLFGMEMQELIAIHTSNGTYHAPESTVCASNRLLKKYIATKGIHDQSLTLFFPSVTKEDVQLFDNAVHKKPDELAAYFKTLPHEQQQRLITIAGKRAIDENEQVTLKMLNAKHLTAQLITIFFGSDIV